MSFYCCQRFGGSARHQHVNRRRIRANRKIENAYRTNIEAVERGDHYFAEKIVAQFSLRSADDVISAQLIELAAIFLRAFLRGPQVGGGLCGGKRGCCER